MHLSTLLTSISIVIGLATASPIPVQVVPRDTYYGVSLHVWTSPGGDPREIASPAPIHINIISPINCGNTANAEGCLVSKLSLDQAPAINVNIDDVECRGYQDAPGTIPGCGPFNVTTPAIISADGLGTIGSLLCYIV